METGRSILWLLIGGILGWTARSFVRVPTGQVLPASVPVLGGNAWGRQVKLRGKIASCSATLTAPAGTPPRAGFQSEPLHHWCYLLADDETAGDVAAAITGEEARYQELVLANPDVAKVGTPGMVGPDEWNFAPGSLAPGSRLTLPQTWNAWIDQLGNPRGQPQPFPEDHRAPAATKGAPTNGVPEGYQLAAAQVPGVNPGQSPPYGQAFSYGAAA